MTPGGARSTERLPLAPSLYIGAVFAVAVGASVLWIRLDPFLHRNAIGWTDPRESLAILVVLGLLTWRIRERDIGSSVSLSLTSAIVLASIVLVDPHGAAVVGLIAPLAAVGATPVAFTALNCAMFSAMGALAGWAYGLVRGPTLRQLSPPELDSGRLWHLVVALVVADLVLCVSNAVILAGMHHVHRGRPFRRILLGTLRNGGLLYVAYGVIGIIFAITWVPGRVGALTGVLVLAPLLVAQWSFAQFGDEQRSHERTLNALVTAMGTKDRITRAHCERVAALCELVARQLALSEQRSEALRYAGLLHDIGMLALPTRLLRKTSPLTDDEIVQVGTHAALGAEMLSGIEFLHPALDGVRHHHERWDGRGYPSRLAGDAIPLFARIIAVADGFDAMTTERGDRPAYPVEQAVQELRARAGAQFDPTLVDALADALVRRPWQLTDPSASFLRSDAAPFDHDCPVTSDEIAAHPDLVDRIAAATGATSLAPPATAEGLVA